MQRPTLKEKSAIEYVDYLENELKKYTNSPYSQGYSPVKRTIDDWNEEIKQGGIKILSDDDNAKFARAHKYFTEIKPYYDILEYFRSKMSESEKEEVDNAALKYATKNGRG